MEQSNYILLLVVATAVCSSLNVAHGQSPTCSSATTCSECLDLAVECQWCADAMISWDGRRCQSSLTGCSSIINLQSSISVTAQHNAAFSKDVQVRPQQVSVSLRSKDSITFTATVRPSRNYPLDVYYLMDHSFSMRDDLDIMKTFASSIASAIGDLTSNFRLGYGSFVDKPMMPFVLTDGQKVIKPCEPCKLPYAYFNALPLSSDSALFNTTINADVISGNFDTPEGTLDAMIQAAVCTNQVGWRSNARRVLLVATDARSHVAGDGKVLGIIRENDGKCHLSSDGYYTDFAEYDFPSLSYLAHVFRREGILPIFMVTSNHQSFYGSAAQAMQSTGARVVQLDANSNNVISLLSEELQRLVNVGRVIVLQQGGVNVSIKASCPRSDSSIDPQTGFEQCTNLTFDFTATYTITLTGLECSKLRDTKQIILRVVGYGDITVNIAALCKCPCETMPEPMSPFCSKTGSNACGVCNCNAGYTDKTSTSKCDCNTLDLAPCIQNGSTVGTCSGRGDCICGECRCRPPTSTSVAGAAYSGRFCECDNFNCPRSDSGVLCGGPSQGRCVCGECQCNANFTQSDCGCPLSDDACVDPSGLMCGGVGTCECGMCQCHPQYAGEFCENCADLSNDCAVAQRCFNCSGTCPSNCPAGELETSTDDNPTINGMTPLQCKSPVPTTGCSSTFYALRNMAASGRCTRVFHPFVVKECSGDSSTSNIVPYTVGPAIALLVIGLLLLILIKAYIYRRDAQEYRKFMKEADRVRHAQNDVNPLYKSATQTYVNTIYQGNEDKPPTKEY